MNLERAIEIAVLAHKGQTDKAGNPYIIHVLSVMMKGNSMNEKICGVLHDLIEDTNWTFQQLKNEGFSDLILEALDSLTRRETESYPEFIERLRNNPLAVRVKLIDIADNINILRLNHISQKDVDRLNRYLDAHKILSQDVNTYKN